MHTLSPIDPLRRALLVGALALAATVSALAGLPPVAKPRPAPGAGHEAPRSEPPQGEPQGKSQIGKVDSHGKINLPRPEGLKPGEPLPLRLKEIQADTMSPRPPWSDPFDEPHGAEQKKPGIPAHEEASPGAGPKPAARPSVWTPQVAREQKALRDADARRQKTREAMTAAMAERAKGNFTAAKQLLLAPGVDQRSTAVRWQLAQIEKGENKGRPPAAQSHLNQALLSDEIQARFANASPQERSRLAAMATVLVGSAYLAAKGTPHERFELVGDPAGQPFSRYRSDKELAATPLPSLRQVPEGAVIYVQNDPSLTQRDWTPQPRGALDAGVSSGLDIRLVPRGGMAVARTYSIVETRDKQEIEYVRQGPEARDGLPERFDSARMRDPCGVSWIEAQARCPPVVLIRHARPTGVRP